MLGILKNFLFKKRNKEKNIQSQILEPKIKQIKKLKNYKSNPKYTKTIKNH